MSNFKDYYKKYYNRDILILCAGSTLKKYKDKVKSLIRHRDMVTIGINNINHILTPDIHLWTNRSRFNTFYKNISDKSELFIGRKLKSEHLKNKKYTVINYSESISEEISYNDDLIIGKFRTAGNLAIFLAHYMGAENILIAGMDGYTYCFEGDQHCWGKGKTDSKDIEHEKEKDAIIYNSLKKMNEYGIDFKIITPTIYNNFYYEGIL